MKIPVLFTTSTLALLLSACGGGGTSSSHHFSHATPMVSQDILDQRLIFSSEINNITIDGKKFDILSDGKRIDDYFVVSKDNTSVNSGNSLGYAKFGITTERNNHKIYYFYAGDRTDRLPTDGIITYTGRAIYGCTSCNSLKVDGENKIATNGQAKFVANFGSGNITGNITSPEIGNLTLQGKIADKGFTGTHNGTKLQGGFHGINAREISGIFTNDQQGIQGAFGAKQSR